MSRGRWEFWIDVGGTFTDCIALAPDGQLRRHKLLTNGVTKGAIGSGSSADVIVDLARSANPPQIWRGRRLCLLDDAGKPVAETAVLDFDNSTGTLRLDPPLPSPPVFGQSYELLPDEEAPILGIRYLLGLQKSEAIPPVAVRLGTTRGTNALLTRRGAKTALVTTRGFGDILHIGYQNRPKLFELNIRKPTPLFCAVVEIDERISATGEVLTSPDLATIHQQLEALRSQGIESLAICLLHGFEHPAHEELVGQVAREIGFDEISQSHQVAPLVKIVARGDTTVLDAYLNPVLRRYVESLRTTLPQCDLRIVTSAGGLMSTERFSGKDSILSGPAAGVVGFSRVAQAAGFTRAIGFDMGGTSTDVSRFDGRHEMEYETEKAGVRVVAPMLAIETVAAGGGSICGFDDVKLVVGPESAGADPGPACYGRGGPLAVTDLNFFLGKILPDRFPFPLDRAAAEQRLAALANEVQAACGMRYTLVELAEGLLRIANANMVQAIRAVSIAKGCDPRDYVLVPFGGAAGQHACAVAAELDITQILHHPDAGLLSAYGIGLADHARHRALTVNQPYSVDAFRDLDSVLRRLELEARAELQQDFPDETDSEVVEVRRRLDLCYCGLDAYLTIDEPADGHYAAAYEVEHRKLYGYTQSGKPLEIVAARVEVLRQSRQQLPISKKVAPPVGNTEPSAKKTVVAYFDSKPHDTKVYDRYSLRPGQSIIGPGIVHEVASTTVIDPGWRGDILSDGSILAELIPSSLHRSSLRPVQQNSALQTPLDPPDPILLEIFNNHFAAIAEQMGITLRNTASSVNVKERLDFSCAIFTPRGELVVNAPHIPVHLGRDGRDGSANHRRQSAHAARRRVRHQRSVPRRLAFARCHRRHAGVSSAVRMRSAEYSGFLNSALRLELRTSFLHRQSRTSRRNRRHHARFHAAVFQKSGRRRRADSQFQADRCRPRATSTSCENCCFPVRIPAAAVDDNLADIAAQVAANHQGARDLLTLVERFTLPVVASLHAAHSNGRRTKTATALVETAARPPRIHRPPRRRHADSRGTHHSFRIPDCRIPALPRPHPSISPAPAQSTQAT